MIRVLLFILCVAFASIARAQKFPSLDKSPMDIAAYPSSHNVSDKEIKIIYSRPQLKGRSLDKLTTHGYSFLVDKQNGMVWRTGANEAPEIVFYKDVVFGGKAVKAGRYNLLTIPGEKEWTIILSNFKDMWGSFFYDAKDDVMRVKAPVSKNSKSIEAFSIVFEKQKEGVNMYFGWSNIIATVFIK